jgi:hypothetical protein
LRHAASVFKVDPVVTAGDVIFAATRECTIRANDAALEGIPEL